ncbi:MAG: sulfate adenylyltransferase subunit CysN [Planctomycetes bacterium]|nr:sulfate adenylyltransferase subunit CysN [Planctomycetota bacterium]
MSHTSDLIATDIDEYLARHERKELLRFITCGSVDDGKSTLIGRLLYDSKMIYEDHLKKLEQDSVKHGTTGGRFDPALLTDGLREEREQGITIDVAYRYFSTAARKFIIADTPGHEQYTRNMATGASTADLAIILIDARHGVLTQTRRHSFIVSLLGIKHVLVAINKMDLVDYREDVFDAIRAECMDFATRLDVPDLHFIPIAALHGDNVVDRSANMAWYQGPTLMGFLETVYIGSDRNLEDLRFPVQYVNRPNLDFRGYCGTIASGILRKGETIMALPSRKTTRIRSIVTFDGERDEAFAPQAVTVTLDDEIDVSRGDMLVRPGNVPRISDQFESIVIWMAESPMVPGRQYVFKHTTRTVTGTASAIRYRVDVNTLHRQDAPALGLNEIGRCRISVNQPIAYDGYRRNRGTGAFIIIDRITNGTVGAGMILDRATEQEGRPAWDEEPRGDETPSIANRVAADERAGRYAQRPATILLTGLTGAGKSTIAYALERRLFDAGRTCAVVCGKSLRRGLSKDLGYSSSERSENLRRGAEIARMLNDAGLICIAAFVAPEDDVRGKARTAIGEDRFLLVHVDAPIETCRERDEAGLYRRADEGLIAHFPGVSAPYERPANADMVLDTDRMPVEECVDRLIRLLVERGFFAE